MASALVLDGLLRRRGERLVLRDVTIEVPEGATVALLGPNGAGKSTLLRVLAGLMRPSGGRCSVLGVELPKDRRALHGRVGYLAHEPMLYRDLTVRENLAHRARLLRAPAGRVDELLAATGLGSRHAFPVHALSRGLTQRTAVAATLLGDPDLLLLDEPLANLDPTSTAQLGALLGIPRDGSATPAPGGGEHEAAAPLGASPGGRATVVTPRARARTLVVAGHDPEAALATSDVVLGLRDGRPTLLADPRNVTAGDLEELYR